MKKSIIALVLTLSMILGMCSVSLAATQTTDPTILLESVEAENGTDVSVRVLIQNNPGIWGMDLRISYDQSALTLTGVENGDFFGESEWTQGNLSADTYILSCYNKFAKQIHQPDVHGKFSFLSYNRRAKWTDDPLLGLIRPKHRQSSILLLQRSV